jgi:hypothetical protein
MAFKQLHEPLTHTTHIHQIHLNVILPSQSLSKSRFPNGFPPVSTLRVTILRTGISKCQFLHDCDYASNAVTSVYTVSMFKAGISCKNQQLQ